MYQSFHFYNGKNNIISLYIKKKNLKEWNCNKIWIKNYYKKKSRSWIKNLGINDF